LRPGDLAQPEPSEPLAGDNVSIPRRGELSQTEENSDWDENKKDGSYVG
ncbi:uncharacterized protein METZ01_LOCUS258427, partial [marine metagenome]